MNLREEINHVIIDSKDYGESKETSDVTADKIIKILHQKIIDKLILTEIEFPISKKYNKKDKRGLYGVDKGSYNRALLDVVEEILKK